MTIENDNNCDHTIGHVDDCIASNFFVYQSSPECEKEQLGEMGGNYFNFCPDCGVKLIKDEE